MGDIDEQTPEIEPGAAGAPEGAVAEPEAAEVEALYKDLGIKAPVPTGKAKGRPKTSKVRAEDDAEENAGDSKNGKQGNVDGKGKSSNASGDDSDGDSGDDSDSKGSKVGKDSGKVSDESEEADKGVRGAKSRAEEDSERGSEDDSDGGADGTGQANGKSSDSEGEGSEEEDSEAEKGKRPGKSNPEIEKRIQKLNSEKKAAEERASALEKQLREKDQAVQQSKIAQEDPEYTVEDFRKVRDRDGNIIDLDPERAELAWRRWKDGYDQRAEERQAKANHVAAQAEREDEMVRDTMKKSADAYDSLAALMDEYPELVSTSGKFDEDFAADAMPIIQEAIEYLPGTEPGNPNDNLPVIVGLRIDPKKILAAMKGISNKKRNLPLNGRNDNVEAGSNVNVPHRRSSDPTVNAANELYKELGINKRI